MRLFFNTRGKQCVRRFRLTLDGADSCDTRRRRCPNGRAVCYHCFLNMAVQPKASTMPDTLSNVDPYRLLPGEILDLVEAIQTLPPEHRHVLEPVLHRVVENSWRRRRILTTIQEAISQLRLDMKYLMFDLEATRRERDDLRERLGPSER